MKICTKCKVPKGLDEFGKDKTGRLGLRASCKKCVNHYKKIYHQNNKDKGNTSSRNWRLANKEQAKANMRVWNQANPDKKNAINAKRRAAKLQRTPSWLTEEDWNKISAFYTEAQRLSKETGIKHEVDHIIPLQGETISGFHHPGNLQVITKVDNLKKGNK